MLFANEGAWAFAPDGISMPGIALETPCASISISPTEQDVIDPAL